MPLIGDGGSGSVRNGVLAVASGRRVPEPVGLAAGEVVGVDADFPGDDGPTLLQCLDLCVDALPVGFEELQAFRLVARTVPHELGEALEVSQRHPGFP